jgi:cellulose synthase (UDP-forming)
MFLPMSWLVQYVVRFAVLVVPPVYLWTGLAPLHFTEVSELVSYQLPVLAAYFLLMSWITPTRYLPVVSSAVGAFSTFRMLPTVISSVVRPFGKPFKVTPKGSGNEENAFDGYTFACLALLTVVTAAGLFVNIVPEWARTGESGFSVVAAYWAGVNIAVLVIASLICFERPSSVQDAFRADEVARIDDLPGRAVSLSLGKAVVKVPIGTRFASKALTVEIEGVGAIEADLRAVTRRRKRLGRTGDGAVHFLHLYYALEGELRDRMIRKLYTGGYSQEVAEIDASALSVSLLGRAFGPQRA